MFIDLLVVVDCLFVLWLVFLLSFFLGGGGGGLKVVSLQ